MNILVHAYAISPHRGSEYAVSWNYVINMSKEHHLYVLCGTSGDFFGDFKDLDAYINEHEMPNITFLMIPPNTVTSILNYPNKRNIFKYSFYWAYKNWEKQVHRYVLSMPYEYDLIHFLGPIGFREPGYLWKINKPYIWGPIGGTIHYKCQAIEPKNMFTKIFFIFKDRISDLQLRYSKRVNCALKKADLLIAINSEEKSRLNTRTDQEIYIMPENGILNCEQYSPDKKQDNFLYLIQIGELSSRKNIKLLLDSLLLMKNKEKIRLKIIGSGKEEKGLMNYVIQNGLRSIVEFTGRVRREEVFLFLKSSDVHILTSVKEAASTVLFEAMSLGVPTLSLNHAGMGDILCKKCGILIDITNYEDITKQIAQKLDDCIEDPTILKNIRHNLLLCRNEWLWSKRYAIFNTFYLKALNRYKSKQKSEV